MGAPRLAVLAMFGCAACAAPGPLVADGFSEPRPSVRVLVMPPDVEIGYLTLSGVETREDWNAAAGRELLTALFRNLQAGGEEIVVLDTAASHKAEAWQVTLLHRAVAEAVMTHLVELDPDRYMGPLPHKPAAGLDYTLSEPMAAVAGELEADYAMFLTARARVESGGVIVSKVLVGAATGQAPPGHGFEGTLVSLVDAGTGELVWVGHDDRGDPRDPKAAAKIMKRIFSVSPLGEGGQ